MKKVLFVCIGNCCRSQMAEGFANFYGSDVLRAESAGLAPTSTVAIETIDTMLEKNVDISRQYPKRLDPTRAGSFDVIVNMSGFPLPDSAKAEVRNWKVDDPFGRSEEIYQKVCNDIEFRVMHLILELRRESSGRRIAQVRSRENQP